MVEISENSSEEGLIKQSNVQTAVRMVRKAGSKLKVFANGSIVLLAIPPKWRLRTEAKRLLCWITKVVKNQYTLICSVGLLTSSHHAKQLNKVLLLNKSSVLLRFPAIEAKLTINKASSLLY